MKYCYVNKIRRFQKQLTEDMNKKFNSISKLPKMVCSRTLGGL